MHLNALNFVPKFSFFSALSTAPMRPFHTWVRATEERFRPPRIAAHRPSIFRAQALVLGSGRAGVETVATVLRETGAGRNPTIVLGGLVPDASEQVFLLRRHLLRAGDIYYVNYSRTGFSLEMLCAQLTDLGAELRASGQAPVIFAVSFGAGIVLEWLRRNQSVRAEPLLAGVILVSPATCVADFLACGHEKPATLIGRALKPFLDPKMPVTDATVEKARTVFLRMFEAGAQNKDALKLLMTAKEAERVRNNVMHTIRTVTFTGAYQRVQALAEMVAPTDYFSPGKLPLTCAPTLILFAEREDAVLDAAAPVLLALERAYAAYFPNGAMQRIIARRGDSEVQHASLIFHVFDFLPPIQAFYQRVRHGSLPLAA